MTVVRKCDSHQGGVKGIRKVSKLMKRCDGYVGDVKHVERCDTCQYVYLTVTWEVDFQDSKIDKS